MAETGRIVVNVSSGLLRKKYAVSQTNILSRGFERIKNQLNGFAMFGLFKKKSNTEKLEAKYKQLMEEAYRLSHIDRVGSAAKTAEAEAIWEEIEALKAKVKSN
jgi:hypothetical protein